MSFKDALKNSKKKGRKGGKKQASGKKKQPSKKAGKKRPFDNLDEKLVENTGQDAGDKMNDETGGKANPFEMLNRKRK